jgi:hypothetical protein
MNWMVNNETKPGINGIYFPFYKKVNPGGDDMKYMMPYGIQRLQVQLMLEKQKC